MPPLAVFDRLLRHLATALLLSLLAAVVAGVISRQIGAPLAWTDELAQYLLVWTGFAGWMIATRKNSHIRITVVTERLTGAVGRGLEVLTQIGIAALGAGLLWHSVALIRRTWDIESVSVPLPAAVLYLPLPLLGLVLIAQALLDARAAMVGKAHVSGGQVL